MPPPMPMQAHHPYEQQNMQQPIPHYPRSPSRVPQPNAHTAQWMNGHYNGGFNGYANSPVGFFVKVNISFFSFYLLYLAYSRVNGIAALILHYLFDYAGPEGLNCITRAKQNPIVSNIFSYPLFLNLYNGLLYSGSRDRVLVECNGFDILSRLCCLYSRYDLDFIMLVIINLITFRLDEWYEKKDGRRSLEELLDNSLTCIYTLMVEPLSPEQTRSRNLCLRQKTFQISLLNFLSGGGVVVRSRVLKLISLLLDCCEGWASSILQVVDDYKGDNLVGIVFNVISIARASAIVR
uniref:Pentatricopeptide repeat-containing protein n=1 Tax=Heterorhabditis bacteriophora TaxID=37862 RepID=A0A1I7WZP6_HETBA